MVANISLMALGSAAAEVMLALIEALITLNKPAGELGPSCIVGAASFNQLMVAAISTTALPHGVFKSIEHLRVYATTACWSMLAHIWLRVVYWCVATAAGSWLHMPLILSKGQKRGVGAWQACVGAAGTPRLCNTCTAHRPQGLRLPACSWCLICVHACMHGSQGWATAGVWGCPALLPPHQRQPPRTRRPYCPHRWWTPDEITVVEAVLTLGFTGVVILHAWTMDTQPWKRGRRAQG